jgi:hypothetical protein
MIKSIVNFGALLVVILGFLKVTHILNISWLEVIFPVWLFLCLLITISILGYIIVSTFTE